MPDLLPLVVLVLALASGLVAAIVVSQQVQAAQPGFYRHFLTQLLLFNLLVLSGLVFRLVQQLPPAGGWNPLVTPALLVFMAGLKIAWLHAFIQATRAPFSSQVPATLHRRLRTGAIMLFCLYFAALAIATLLPSDAVFQASVIALELLIIGGALLATTQLLLAAHALPGGKRRRTLVVFGAFHAVLLVSILVVIFSAWISPGSQSASHMLANATLLLVYNLFPIFWIRHYQPATGASAGEKLATFGITGREKEIIELIQAGKTNREIAESLFISVATVKDHNNNLFRKCGVRNRVELGNLFR